ELADRSEIGSGQALGPAPAPDPDRAVADRCLMVQSSRKAGYPLGAANCGKTSRICICGPTTLPSCALFRSLSAAVRGRFARAPALRRTWTTRLIFQSSSAVG